MIRLTRTPSDPAALEAAIAAAPLRFVYLRDYWPEADVATFQKAAPAEAVVRTLTRELEVLRGVLDRERCGRKSAEKALSRFVDAAQQVVDRANPETLFGDES